MKGKKLSRESLLKRSTRIIDPEGNIYLMKEFAEKQEISVQKVKEWVKSHESDGYVLEESEHKKYKILAPNGKTYNSLSSCAKDYGRESKTIKNWAENYPEKGFKYL